VRGHAVLTVHSGPRSGSRARPGAHDEPRARHDVVLDVHWGSRFRKEGELVPPSDQGRLAMLTIQLTRAISPEAAIAALVIASSFLIKALTRLLVLCVLAARATRMALQDPGAGEPDAAAIRAHRLAVLQAILAVLKPRGGPGGGSGS
jgi:hypothetical protein